MTTITVKYQVIESDFTWWDKFKRFGRSLVAKTKNFIAAVWRKTWEAADAIAKFFDQPHTASNRFVDEVAEIFTQIKQDWEGEDMISQIANFLFGPPPGQNLPEAAGNYTEFSTRNVAGQMMGAVVSQNGYVSEEQVEQFGAIARNSDENFKRLKVVLAAIQKVSSNETEMSKEVYRVMHKLESDAFKRSEYQYNRRREHSLMQEKFSNLRRGL